MQKIIPERLDNPCPAGSESQQVVALGIRGRILYTCMMIREHQSGLDTVCPVRGRYNALGRASRHEDSLFDAMSALWLFVPQQLYTLPGKQLDAGYANAAAAMDAIDDPVRSP